ncbi:MAG: hypothetical protein ACRC0G_14030 [Fusobacteriaceae bacterium]
MNKWAAAGVMVVILIIASLFFRVIPWAKCTMAQYDLKRETSFSWVTGKCMVTRNNGERVYLDQMRDSGE